MKVFYSPDYVSASHSWDTTRKSQWVADALAAYQRHGVKLVAPVPATPAQLLRCHSEEYVRAVRSGEPVNLAQSNGFQWCPNVFKATTASTGGVIEAVLEALRMNISRSSYGVSGSLSSGLHHARRDHGAGFCTFNGLMVAARAALESRLAKKILIVDYDAHFGDGTIQMIHENRLADSVHMIDVSTRYAAFHVPNVRDSLDGQHYLMACRSKLDDAVANNHYDLVIYNAGADPHEDCRIGGMGGVTTQVLAERDEYVFRKCIWHNLPVAFVLAGGYSCDRFTKEELTQCHVNTVRKALMVESARRGQKTASARKGK